jgi:adenylate cyclase class 2
MKIDADNNNNLEVEVKFHLKNIKTMFEALNGCCAELTQPRIFERNLRFDTPDGRLRAAGEVLRLREDSRYRLTFKGPALADQSVAIRPEIEFTVDDLEEARRFLEALGYEVSVIYEKYRTTFNLEGAEITVDEMPFGEFCEIEAFNAIEVERLAKMLNLEWEDRILGSYLQLFETLKTRRSLDMRDLTFENFRGLDFVPGDYLPS